MFFDVESLSSQEIYRFLVGGVTPRPIAWISTLSKNGVANIAPYSFFNVASCSPPVLWFSQVNPMEGGDKNTLANILETKECVIHVVNEKLLEKMNLSCASLPASQSEFEFADIEYCMSHSVKPLSVKEAPVRYECNLREVLRISSLPSGGSVVLMNVSHIYIDDSILEGMKINQGKLDSVGKMGADFYSLTTSLLEMPRP
ncbi:flavin reductase family protein [Gilvimarinus algae]|uniref:Flavin reductase family protein n=1 Tax=Gilvimarinus algae TaxID=3058037 RepID=A0ABT8TAV7_9GAMM|nr:flavin reductase family protein [Gilvimarinus sp. SDUM040014]MDO3381247.1 flavin reductase family protein [Gilvimarinus sp. SDUM040014]